MDNSIAFARELIQAGVKQYKIVAGGSSYDDERAKSKLYESWSESQKERGDALEVWEEFLRRQVNGGAFTLYYQPKSTTTYQRYDFRVPTLYQPNGAPVAGATISGVPTDFIQQQISTAIAGVNEQWIARIEAMEAARERKELQREVERLKNELSKKESTSDRTDKIISAIASAFSGTFEQAVINGINKIGGTPQIAGEPAQPQPANNSEQGRYETAANTLVTKMGNENFIAALEKLSQYDAQTLNSLLSSI